MRRLLSAAVLAAGLALCSAAQAITYTASLNGPSESPPNASPGTGSAEVDIDTIANSMAVMVTFTNLTSGTTASHIHCCTASPGAGTAIVATQTPFFIGFPIGVTSGTYTHTFSLLDLATYNSAFVTANGGTAASAEAALLAGLAAGDAYLNVHTSNFPSGEIRGFLAAPEPSAWALMIAGVAVTGLALRRRRRLAAAV